MSRTELRSFGLGCDVLDRLDQRQKLETHLPAAERKGLDDDDIRLASRNAPAGDHGAA
jgi:hypothetical protein